MNQPTAVVIEDDKHVAEFYQFTLEDVGYKVSIALNGRTGLEKLEKEPPDLIILDMHLPDANGQDILNQVRQDKRWQNCFVILATGESQTVDKQADEMANFVLIKPIEYEQLLTLAQRIYQSRQD